MRKKIKGHVYNTATAELICKTCTWQGTLYRKYNSNQFFLLSNNGENITPIDWKQAKDIAHKYAPSYRYMELFTSRCNQDGRTNIDISKRDKRMLDAIAGNRNVTVKALVHEMVYKEYRKLDRHLTEI